MQRRDRVGWSLPVCTGRTESRFLLGFICLNSYFFGFLQFGVDQGEGLVIFFPIQLEVCQLLKVGLSSKESLEVLLQASDTFVLGNHFLEVASALGGASGSQVLRKRFEDLTEPAIDEEVLSLAFGGKDCFVIVDEEGEFQILLQGPLAVLAVPTVPGLVVFRVEAIQFFLLRVLSRCFRKYLSDGTITARHVINIINIIDWAKSAQYSSDSQLRKIQHQFQ